MWPEVGIGGVSAGTVLLFAVLAVFRGWLVPAWTMKTLDESRQDQINECLDRERAWREAFFAERDRAGEAVAQTRELLEYAQTVEALVQALLGREHEESD